MFLLFFVLISLKDIFQNTQENASSPSSQLKPKNGKKILDDVIGMS